METFPELRTAGVQLFGKIGAWTYDEWKRLNQVFFKGQNQVGAIYWVSDTENECLGRYFFSKNIIYLHKGLVRPRYPINNYKWCFQHLNQRLASDVLLHEMIHQSIHQSGGRQGETSHNNNRFVDEVNRIAKLLQLNVTATVINKNKCSPILVDDSSGLNFQELSNFPYSSRPYGYYYGGWE